MAMSRESFSHYRLRNFDRAKNFVVLRETTLNGEVVKPGSKFPKEKVSARLHNILFNQRLIDEVGGVWHRKSGLPDPWAGAGKKVAGTARDLHPRHVGKGKWAVFEGDMKISADLANRKAAEDYIDTLRAS